MALSGMQRDIGQAEIGRRLDYWSGRELTEGLRKGLKMVAPYETAQDERSMTAVMDFASQIAHHFNNLLSVMSGYGGLLKARMVEGDPSLAYVEKMLASSQKARDVVRSLFLFTGDEKSRLREVDLNRVIKRAARFIERNQEKKGTARMELHDNSLFVMADVVKMEEVLANLIENAWDAMPRGGTLTLKTERCYRMGKGCEGSSAEVSPYASFSVVDTGIGMDRETKEKMFDPFFTTKNPGRNMGLGLSKVYGIVKQHSGEISVESEPGKGTSIRIYIPLVESGIGISDPIPLPDSVIAGRVPLCSTSWRL